MRKAIIDIDKLRLIEFDGMLFKGECNRCGKCCRESNCMYLGMEIVDNKPRHKCNVYWGLKPARCSLYPMPTDNMPEGCGFYWEPK